MQLFSRSGQNPVCHDMTHRVATAFGDGSVTGMLQTTPPTRMGCLVSIYGYAFPCLVLDHSTSVSRVSPWGRNFTLRWCGALVLGGVIAVWTSYEKYFIRTSKHILTRVLVSAPGMSRVEKLPCEDRFNRIWDPDVRLLTHGHLQALTRMSERRQSLNVKRSCEVSVTRGTWSCTLPENRARTCNEASRPRLPHTG